MARRVNDPQRVITRGKTRTIGEPRRAREGSDTVGVKREPRVTARPAERSDTSQERFTPGEARQAQSRRAVPTAEPQAAPAAPRQASERRPLERIETLELQLTHALIRIDELERDMYGIEEVIPRLSETLGGLVETVGDMGDAERAPRGLVHATALLAEQLQELRPRDTVAPPEHVWEITADTQPPSEQPPTEQVEG
jgi:uncharacterized coiled-coil protein SlyX